jgi:hypothetical protein
MIRPTPQPGAVTNHYPNALERQTRSSPRRHTSNDQRHHRQRPSQPPEPREGLRAVPSDPPRCRKDDVRPDRQNVTFAIARRPHLRNTSPSARQQAGKFPSIEGAPNTAGSPRIGPPKRTSPTPVNASGDRQVSGQRRPRRVPVLRHERMGRRNGQPIDDLRVVRHRCGAEAREGIHLRSGSSDPRPRPRTDAAGIRAPRAGRVHHRWRGHRRGGPQHPAAPGVVEGECRYRRPRMLLSDSRTRV